jgi:hypothetical protein
MNIDDERDLDPEVHDNTASTSSANKESTQPLDEEAGGPYLSLEDFTYSMTLVDKKITALYELCRYISSQQQENSKSLKKLVALDELTESFWNVSYKISKNIGNILIFLRPIFATACI